MSNLSTLQSASVTLCGYWQNAVTADRELTKKTSDFFKAGLATLGPLTRKDKAGNEVKATYGLEAFFTGVFSGDKTLIPEPIQAILAAKRADKCEEDEITDAGIIKNRWSSMLSTLQAEPKDPKVKADELTTIKAALERLLETRNDETVQMLAELGFMDDRA